MFYRIYYFLLDWLSGKPLGGGLRSPKWRQVRKANIKNKCECCGEKGTLLNPLNLHHILPFHISPQDELNPKNFITACRHCHLLLCHLKSWKSFNKDIKVEAEILLKKIQTRP